MSEWKSKRFWKDVSVKQCGEAFGIALDTRAVKTPLKTELIVPTRALASAIAEEWEAQEDEINPLSMPFTRSANAAIDKVALQHDEVAELLAAYADADLLCYRAEGPDGLVSRQKEAWDPLLDWAERTYGARLVPVTGVMHQSQDAKALATFSDQVHGMDAFTLTAFHDLVGLSGSFIIGLAALENLMSPKDLWHLSRVDEAWQEELWGVDEEAHALALQKEAQFAHAKTFYDLANKTS